MNKVAICICTYKRDKLLLNLLNSIFSQKMDVKEIDYDIYIIDNYGKSNLKKMINNLNKENIFYFIEKNRGISSARNRCIKEIKTLNYEYCIFVDDDEKVDEKWLKSLIKCVLVYGANIVVGSLISIYPENVPNWIVKSKFFKHKRYATGTQMTSFATNNTLISKKLIDKDMICFDEAYSFTGGEDTKLSKTLILKGEKIIYCNEAVVYENVSSNRLNMKYMLKRVYVNSLVHVKIEKELYGRTCVVIKRIISSMFFIFSGILKIPLILIKGKIGIFSAMKCIVKGWGQLTGLIGYTKNLY